MCKYIHEFVVKLNIDNPIIFGHSYGGRIGIIYASLYKVRGLVLVSSAGVKAKLNISKRLRIKMYKLFKKVGINVKLGSKDYRDSDNVKRAMLVNAVNTDLTNEMEKINVSTILIYGENDKETPKEIAEYINTHIKNSSLVMMEDCGHFPYLEKPTIFSLILNSFLTGIST